MSGGGFGALDSMNKSIENNRKLVNKRSAFERIKGYSSALRGKKINLSSKKMTKEELLQLRQTTIRQDRIHTFVQILKMIFVLAILAVLLILLISGPFGRYGGS